MQKRWPCLEAPVLSRYKDGFPVQSCRRFCPQHRHQICFQPRPLATPPPSAGPAAAPHSLFHSPHGRTCVGVGGGHTEGTEDGWERCGQGSLPTGRLHPQQPLTGSTEGRQRTGREGQCVEALATAQTCGDTGAVPAMSGSHLVVPGASHNDRRGCTDTSRGDILPSQAEELR